MEFSFGALPSVSTGQSRGARLVGIVTSRVSPLSAQQTLGNADLSRNSSAVDGFDISNVSFDASVHSVGSTRFGYRV